MAYPDIMPIIRDSIITQRGYSECFAESWQIKYALMTCRAPNINRTLFIIDMWSTSLPLRRIFIKPIKYFFETEAAFVPRLHAEPVESRVCTLQSLEPTFALLQMAAEATECAAGTITACRIQIPVFIFGNLAIDRRIRKLVSAYVFKYILACPEGHRMGNRSLGIENIAPVFKPLCLAKNAFFRHDSGESVASSLLLVLLGRVLLHDRATHMADRNAAVLQPFPSGH